LEVFIYLSTHFLRSVDGAEWHGWESSAYRIGIVCFNTNGMSFIKIVKRRGPRIDPCGTPDFGFSGPDRQFLILV